MVRIPLLVALTFLLNCGPPEYDILEAPVVSGNGSYSIRFLDTPGSQPMIACADLKFCDQANQNTANTVWCYLPDDQGNDFCCSAGASSYDAANDRCVGDGPTPCNELSEACGLSSTTGIVPCLTVANQQQYCCPAGQVINGSSCGAPQLYYATGGFPSCSTMSSECPGSSVDGVEPCMVDGTNESRLCCPAGKTVISGACATPGSYPSCSGFSSTCPGSSIDGVQACKVDGSNEVKLCCPAGQVVVSGACGTSTAAALYPSCSGFSASCGGVTLTGGQSCSVDGTNEVRICCPRGQTVLEGNTCGVQTTPPVDAAPDCTGLTAPTCQHGGTAHCVLPAGRNQAIYECWCVQPWRGATCEVDGTDAPAPADYPPCGGSGCETLGAQTCANNKKMNCQPKTGLFCLENVVAQDCAPGTCSTTGGAHCEGAGPQTYPCGEGTTGGNYLQGENCTCLPNYTRLTAATCKAPAAAAPAEPVPNGQCRVAWGDQGYAYGDTYGAACNCPGSTCLGTDADGKGSCCRGGGGATAPAAPAPAAPAPAPANNGAACQVWYASAGAYAYGNATGAACQCPGSTCLGYDGGQGCCRN